MTDNGNNWDVFTEVLARISDTKTMALFLRDVMTEKELDEMSARLQAAVMLNDKQKYLDVSGRTGLSSRTVARISDWLKQNNGGYSEAIRVIEKHHLHR